MNDLKTRFVEHAVKMGMEDIANNDEMALHRLLNLGSYFSSSEYSQLFYDQAHKLISDQNSFYHQFVPKAGY